MDGVKIYVPCRWLWKFYLSNRPHCRESYVLVAENQDTGYGVYLTEEDCLPVLYVFLGENDRPELRAEIPDEVSAEAIAGKAYLAFLGTEDEEPEESSWSAQGSGSREEEPEEGELEDEPDEVSEDDEIYAREDELFQASGDFLAEVLRMYDGEAIREIYGEALIEEFLEQALLTIADDFGLPVYRPTHLEGENGESVYVEYPYGEEDGQ